MSSRQMPIQRRCFQMRKGVGLHDQYTDHLQVIDFGLWYAAMQADDLDVSPLWWTQCHPRKNPRQLMSVSGSSLLLMLLSL